MPMSMAAERAPALLPLLLLFLLSTADLASSQISMPPSQISMAPSPAASSSGRLRSFLSPYPSPPDPQLTDSPSASPISPASPMDSVLPPLTPLQSLPPTPPPSSIPAPAPLPDDKIQARESDAESMEEVSGSGSGNGGGARGDHKAGIAVGVISAAALAWMGVAVYRKRRQNVRRARYGDATRTDML